MKQQQGFSLVMAIFILIVLGLLGSYMVTLSAVQVDTASNALQGARAYQAARAGIEWAIAYIVNSSTPGTACTQINSQTPMTFAGINGFTVTLSCSASQTYSEASSSYQIYTIDSRSEFGSYADSNYVAREFQVTITP